MEELLLLQEGLQVYLLILMRLGAFLIIAPFWSSGTIPLQVRIFFGLLLSLVLYPLVGPEVLGIGDNFLGFVFLAVRELLLGLLLGITSSMLFSAIQVAGQVIDTQMGFGMVNVLDPQSGMQVPLMGNFLYMVALILFLLSDGHHHFLQALVHSFDMVPLGTIQFPSILGRDLTGLFGQILVFALRIALPVAGVLFLADLSLGIIARTVPQMNVFVLGIPAKILVGILTILMILPLYVHLLRVLFREIFRNLDLLLGFLG